MRERAVRMVLKHQDEYGSQWEAICSVAETLGPTAETVPRNGHHRPGDCSIAEQQAADEDGAVEVAPLVVSVAALCLALASFVFARRDRTRDRVWDLLQQGNGGTRSIDALSHDEDQTIRVVMVKRTANQLELAGAKSLGEALKHVCSQPWGTETTAESTQAREEFRESVVRFMNWTVNPFKN